MKQKLYLATFLVLLLAACSPTVKEEEKNVSVDIRGKWVDDNQYVNDFFEVAIDIPEDWSLKKGSSKQAEDSTSELFSDSDPELKEPIESAIENTYTAFWAHLYPVGTKGKTNPNVSLMIENVEKSPEITSAKGYLLAMENTLKKVNETISFVEKPSLVNMGGLDFWKAKVIMPVNVFKVHQEYYVMKEGKYILLISVSTVSEEDKQTISQVKDTIRKFAE